MKIWIDILTPKQLLFSEPIIEKLEKKHKILCTTRKYREVNHLVKIRKIRVKVVGKHGGIQNSEKLRANINRMKSLMPIIERFRPDVTISFCSPDAARISYGLKINHVAFCDSPHAIAVMKLTIPLIQKLLVPWIIPKKEFIKFGIDSKNIITYKAIDAALIISQKSKNIIIPKNFKKGNNILLRTSEVSASYAHTKINLKKIIGKISKIENVNIIILGRYSDEIKELKKRKNNCVFVLKKSVDSGKILELADVFVGSGGTMTAEAALRGIPTLSYNAIPNIIEEYLVRKKLVTRIEDIDELDKTILRILNKKPNKNRALKEFIAMENPIKKLELVLRTFNE